MNETYFPILKAKSGEFEALKNLKSSNLGKVVPIMEIPKPDDKALATAIKHSSMPYSYCLENTVSKLAKAYPKGTIFFDTFYWDADFCLEDGSHVLTKTYKSIIDHGLKPFPIVGYDRWEVPEYVQAIDVISSLAPPGFCLRLDEDAMDDMADTEHFEDKISEICIKCSTSPSKFTVLLDFGDVSKKSVSDIIEGVENSYRVLKSFGFVHIIMAGSSIPTLINEAVKEKDSTDMLLRKEMLAWQGFYSANPQANIYFGDYGIRNPSMAEGTIAPHMNGKIRYTINKNFFIARGHSVQEPDKYSQMHTLALEIFSSLYYQGVDYSWGDKRISEMAFSTKNPGNSTTWIGIDTNHHVTFVSQEVGEFSRQVFHSTTRAVQ